MRRKISHREIGKVFLRIKVMEEITKEKTERYGGGKILVLLKITKLKLKDKLEKCICNICQIVKILICKGLLQINGKKITFQKKKRGKAMYRKITQKYKLPTDILT